MQKLRKGKKKIMLEKLSTQTAKEMPLCHHENGPIPEPGLQKTCPGCKPGRSFSFGSYVSPEPVSSLFFFAPFKINLFAREIPAL